MRHLSFAACAALTVCLSACDVSVEGGLTGGLVETVREPLPPKMPNDPNFLLGEFCRPDSSASNPTLILEVEREGTFCEFEEPLAVDRYELVGLEPGRRYQVVANAFGLADTLIDIYSVSGRSLAFDDDLRTDDRSSGVIFEADASEVIVEVRSSGREVGPAHLYRLIATASRSRPAVPCAPDMAEENDTEADAFRLGTGTGPDGRALNFCEDAVDYFLLDVTPGEIRQLSIFNEGVNTVAILEAFAGPSETAGIIEDLNFNSFRGYKLFDVPMGVTSILVKVTSFLDAAGDGQSYFLTTRDLPTGPDSFEDNDTDRAGEPAELGTGTPRDGIQLNFVDDPIDYFLLDVTPGFTYRVETIFLSDIILEVYGGITEASPMIASDFDGFDDPVVGFTVPMDVTKVLIKVIDDFDPSVPIPGVRSYRLFAQINPPDLSITNAGFRDPLASIFLAPRTLPLNVLLANNSQRAATALLAYVLSTDPRLDSSDLRIPDSESLRFRLMPDSEEFLPRMVALPDTSNGVFYVGALVLSSNLADEVDESNNQVVLPPMRLTQDDSANCIEDAADTEYLIGLDGPGSGGDDNASTSPLVSVNPLNPMERVRSHCVDSDDWSQFFIASGRGIQISTAGLGTEGDTVLGLYRDRGQTLIMENDDLPGTAGTSRNSFLRYVSEKDEILFVRASSSNGTGPNRRYNIIFTPLSLTPERFDEDFDDPDLIASVVSAPETVGAGNPFNVIIEVINLGGGIATESTAQISLACATRPSTSNQETIIPLDDILVPALRPESASELITRQLTINPASLPIGFSGACELFAVADSEGVVDESVDFFGDGRLRNSAGDRAIFIRPAG